MVHKLDVYDVRSTLFINTHVSFIHSGESLYAMSSEKTSVSDKRELFSFGSGSWHDGVDAKDLMESAGLFIPCCVSLDTLIILEKKRILTHLSELPCLERAATLRDVLTRLEDHGEAGFGSDSGAVSTSLVF